jgi:hypothetical protein
MPALGGAVVMKTILSISLACFGLFALQNHAFAASTIYSFDTSTIVELRNGVVATSQQQLFPSTSTIALTLTYDDSAAGTSDPFGTLYANLSSISASVDGWSYNDSNGTTLVSDDQWQPIGSSDLVDALLLQSCRCSQPAFGSPQLSDGLDETFTLLDTRVFWGENYSGADFLSNELLPSVLPPAGGGSGAVALQFVTMQGSTIVDSHTVRGQISAVSAVPIPAAVWLFGSGLGLLGWFRRRRT